MGKYLTAAEIDRVDDLPIVDVPVDEWGGVVRLRLMTVKEADCVSAMSRSDVVSLDEVRSRWIVEALAAVMVDGNGQPLYADAATGGDALLKRNHNAVNVLFEKFMEMNGVGSKEDDQGKKSETTDVSDSSTDSPHTSESPSDG